jgi:hypothetical protein
VRQRNDSGQPLTVHTDPPRVVAPDEVIDHDGYVIGLTAVVEPDTAPPPSPTSPSKGTKPAGKETTP